MRRLARRLFTLCSAASFMLCAGVCALWVRSHYVCDWAWRGSVHGQHDATGIAITPAMLKFFDYWEDEYLAEDTSDGSNARKDGADDPGEPQDPNEELIRFLPEDRRALSPKSPPYGEGLHHFSVTADDYEDLGAHPVLWRVPVEFPHDSVLWDRLRVRIEVLHSSTIVEDDEEEIVGWSVEAPSLAAAVLLAVPPACWGAAKVRRRRARRLGHCPSCGYGLRATPGRCPECGTERSGEQRSQLPELS